MTSTQPNENFQVSKTLPKQTSVFTAKFYVVGIHQVTVLPKLLMVFQHKQLCVLTQPVQQRKKNIIENCGKKTITSAACEIYLVYILIVERLFGGLKYFLSRNKAKVVIAEVVTSLDFHSFGSWKAKKCVKIPKVSNLH